MWYITYDTTPCSGLTPARAFCEGSGWGNEEATVVCRESGFNYGLGSESVKGSAHTKVYRFSFQDIF